MSLATQHFCTAQKDNNFSRLLCSTTWHVLLPSLQTALLVLSLICMWNVTESIMRQHRWRTVDKERWTGNGERKMKNGERRTWNGERRARAWHRKYIGRNRVVGKVRGSDTSVNSRGVLSHLKSLFFLFLFLICVSSQSLFSPFFFIYLIFFAKFFYVF